LYTGTNSSSDTDGSIEIFEGDSVYVSFEVCGPLGDNGQFAANQVLTIGSDVNFDEEIDTGDYREFNQWNAITGPGWYSYSFHFPDDGPWPGNGTPDDEVNIVINFAGVTAARTVTVVNVAPIWHTRPTITKTALPENQWLIRVAAEVFDPGVRDELTFVGQWGDGVTTTWASNAQPANANLVREVHLERVVSDLASVELLPLSLAIYDDDTGHSKFTFQTLDVTLNDDDDNENGIKDKLEPGFDSEDDLFAASLANLIPLGVGENGEYLLQYDPSSILLWASDLKDTLIVPYNTFGLGTDRAGVTIVPYTGQTDVWVEGIGSGASTIQLDWRDPAGGLQYGLPFDRILFGGVIDVGVWKLDVDIDSDNNNGFNLPEGSAWEEYLEDSEHAIGKMLQVNDSHFTPVRIRLPQGMDPNRQNVRVQFDFDPVGESGIVRVWNTYKANPARLASSESVLDGGNRIVPNEAYSLKQIGYDPATGGATIYLDAKMVNPRHYSKFGIDQQGKPDDRIMGKLLLPSSSLDDQVKYMIVEENSFYPNLQSRRELRSAMASEGVYASGKDLPEFALKLLNPDDLNELQVPQHIIDLLGEPESIPGFKNAIYHDHISGAYVLAFAGTDDVDDILVDVWQGLGYFTDQYHAAMQIGHGLSIWAGEQDVELIATGHSLGGGLASAAAVVGNIPTDTFNAAGLVEDTLLAMDAQGNAIPGAELYPGSLMRYQTASQLVNAYYLDWDILSFVQDYSPLQDAIGFRIEMDGPVDSAMALYSFGALAGLLTGAGWFSIAASLGRAGYHMGLAHTTLYYQYGLMVNESTGWDIHGYGL